MFIDNIENCGYNILFLLHPNLQQQREDYRFDERVDFPERNELDYDRSLRESQIMVTDYSGIQFDFAYMRKPIIYFHHKELHNHLDTSEFFSYEKNGFGDICADIISLKNMILETVYNGGRMTPKYRERIDKFFMFNDYDNCKRIYEEIIKI